MGKLHKNLKKFDPMARVERKVLGDDTYDSLHPIGTSMEQARDMRKAAENAATAAANEPVMPIADLEALSRSKKKSLARRNRGRASTILANDSETLG